MQPLDIGPAARDLREAVRRALEAKGIEFIDENDGGHGVRLRKPGLRSGRRNPQ